MFEYTQIGIRAKEYLPKWEKNPNKSRLEAIDEQGRLEVMEGKVQSVKSEMQRGFDSVHESLQWIPTLERDWDVVKVKLDQLLSQRGEGSSNAWTSVGRGNRESTKVLKSVRRQMGQKMPGPHREWVHPKNTQKWDNRV